MKCFSLAVVALVAGCAATPAELRMLAPIATFDTNLEPLAAAQCLGRAAESYPKLLAADQFAAAWREGPDRQFEVLVRRTLSVPLLVADVAPTSQGSKVTMWQSDTLAGDHDLGMHMAKGCNASGLVVRDMAPKAN